MLAGEAVTVGCRGPRRRRSIL